MGIAAEETGTFTSDGRTPTLRAFLGHWLELQSERLRPATLGSYTGLVERYLVPHLGDVALDQLDSERIERLYHHLLTEGGTQGKPLAIRTVGTVDTVLRTALDDACARGLIEHNVAVDVDLPRIHPRTGIDGDQSTVHAWTRDELHRFLDVIVRHPLAPLVRTAVGTGARCNELLAITWDDVDLDASSVRIDRTLRVDRGRARRQPLRAGRPRTVHVDPTTLAALEAQRGAQASAREAAGDHWSPRWPLVFTGSEGRHLQPANLRKEFRDLVRLTDVQPIAFGDLRHTHAVLLLQAGAAIHVVSARLGHRTLQRTVDTYAHSALFDREAARMLGSCLQW